MRAFSQPSVPPLRPAQLHLRRRLQGTSTRFRAARRTCPRPGLLRIEVIGSAFQFRWDRDTYVDATIAPDGTISGGAERITLAGRQADRKLEGDVTDGDCSLHFTVTRRP